jgi:hypothetical protein
MRTRIFGAVALGALTTIAACGHAAVPVSNAPLTYSCAVSNDNSDTEYTGTTALTFTVTVDNQASYAQQIPTLDIYAQPYGGNPGTYQDSIGGSAPVGTSTQTFKVSGYTEIQSCSVTGAWPDSS